MPRRVGRPQSNFAPFRDEFPHVNVSDLRKAGILHGDDAFALISFGPDERELERTCEVKLHQMALIQGGSWTQFICPNCFKRAKNLRWINDGPRCIACDGLQTRRYRTQGVDKLIANLREKLYGPKPVKWRRLSLELSLREAEARRNFLLLKEAKRKHER
jgi:hypothetical protein